MYFRRYFPFKQIFAALVLVTVMVLAAVPQDKPLQKRYRNPTGSEFPIRAWTSFEMNTIPSDEELRWLKEAGFNIGTEWIGDTATIAKVLDKAAEAGIRMVIASSQIGDLNKLPSTVTRFKDNKALWGYFVSDEPRPAAFPECRKYKDAILRYDPDAEPFVNLFPAASSDLLQASDYRDYIRKFIKAYDPNMLCMDCYPIRISNSGHPYVYKRYYETLEILTQEGKTNNIPFWAVCLSVAHEPFQFPNLYNMRFSAFSALAYGAQGIGWWTYLLPENHTDAVFTLAPIDKSGERTSIWYDLKRINNEIQSLKNVFLNAELVDVWHTGNVIPSGTRPVGKLPGPFNHITSGPAGVLISHLQNNGTNYLMIVNHDIENPQKVSFTLSDTITRVISDEHKTPYRLNEYTLEPSGYVIFQF